MLLPEDFHLDQMRRTYHEVAHRRLLQLASGGEPVNPLCGICHELDVAFIDEGLGRGVAYEYSAQIFTALGLNPGWPIGSDYPMWTGRNGDMRRTLANRMAEYIKANFLK